MIARRLAVAGLALLTISCSSERDAANVKIDLAYALPISGDGMGGPVPDRFRIYVTAYEDGQHRVQPGDTFRAALNVGTASNVSKYGGIGGLRFTIEQPIAHSQQFNYTAYSAVSDALEISCDAQNRLRFTVSGESTDDIQLRVKTAAMPDHWLLWQNGHPGAMLPGHNPNGNQTQRYHCLVERQP